MAVGRADANGAGSTSANRVDAGTDQGKPVQPKPAQPKPAQPKPTGRGNAGGQNATWSEAPLQLGAIDKARDRVLTALDEESRADAARKSKNYSEASLAAYQEAKKEVQAARSRFSEAIENEVARGARSSPFSPLPKSADVRHRAEALVKAYTGKKGESVVREEIDANQKFRVEVELDDASEAAQHSSSSPEAVSNARSQELNDILDDAADLVTRRRPGDGATASEEALKLHKFIRLDQLVKSLNQNYENLDKGVLAQVVIRCATAMNISEAEDLKILARIMAHYPNPKVTDWINARWAALSGAVKT